MKATDKKLSKPKVIFIDLPHPVLVTKLEAAGFSCALCAGMPYADIEPIVHEYFGLIINSRFRIGSDLLDRAFRLKFIGRVGSGMDNIDVEYAKKKGILCLNSPEGNRDAVAEHCIGLLLALLNRMHAGDRQIRKMKWDRESNRGVEIKGKTVGIIGYGNMGAAFAERLTGFGLQVIAYDKYKHGFSGNQVLECSLEELQEKADIISLHVPLSEETTKMFDDSFVRKCKKKFYLINTARGKVVDQAALAKGLQLGQIAGAALDVLDPEGRTFEQLKKDQITTELQYLLNADNVILTPHVAGWSVESKFRLADVLADKIIEQFKP